jgi:hypothetical protein
MSPQTGSMEMGNYQIARTTIESPILGVENMAKSSILVIGEDPYEIMRPFDEELETRPRIRYRYEDREYIWKQAVDGLKERLYPVDLRVRNEALLDSFLTYANMGPDKYYEFIRWRDPTDSEGNILTSFNPKAQYDYQIPGDDEFPVHVGNEIEWRGSARVGEIDWDLMKERRTDGLIGQWRGSRESMEDFLERMGVRSYQEFLDSYNIYYDYAVVDELGQWHSPGSFAWFSPSCPQYIMKRWIQNFFNRFIRHLDEGTMLNQWRIHY